MRPRTERETVERGAGSDDAEADLDELIRIMVRCEPEGVSPSQKLRHDEFVCTSCHMAQHQSRLADVGALVCAECVGGLTRQRSSAARTVGGRAPRTFRARRLV